MERGALVEEGRGVSVVSGRGRDAGGQHFESQDEALQELLAGDERPAVLLSVAGAYRGGKSFLLNYMLRYLYADERARSDGSWLGAAHAPLRGFSWRGGSARDTAGLVLWSHVAKATLPSGEEVAVLLMDTQGSFDEHSSLRDSSQIFALSTLLSSVQVYNLSKNVNEIDLQHLQVFTEYASAGGGALPGLLLLVRDWSAPYEFPYGAGGGAAYLRQKLQEREEQPRELREVRRRLATSFARVGCFLMPHPGLEAETDPTFTGQLAGLQENFKQSLLELVPLLLAPANLRVKTVAGRPLRARELPALLRTYLHAFRLRVPSPQDILTATATVQWQVAATAARAAVSEALPRDALPRAALRERLDAARSAALAPLRPLAERAGDLDGLAALEREIDSQLARFVEINSSRLAAATSAAQLQWEQETRAPGVARGAVCRHARRLERSLAAARAAALARYDRAVAAAPPPIEDADRAALVTWIHIRYDELVEINTKNNCSAVDKADEVSCAHMKQQDSTLQRSPAALNELLADAKELGVDEFKKRRASLTDFGNDDRFYNILIEKIQNTHDRCHSENEKKATKADVAGVAAQNGLLGVATVATGPVGAVASAGACVALVGNCVNAYYKN